MGKSPEYIVELYNERKAARGPVLARMAELRDAYNGDVVIPLPELDRTERVAVANLLAQGLDQTAMRIASQMPNCYFPPVKPGQDKSERYANIRRRATLGWWRMNHLDLMQQRRARHLIGYATSPVIIRPDMKRKIPMWHQRDPLSTYPASTVNPDDMCPDDCIFGFTRTLGWLQRNYPEQLHGLNKGRFDKPDDAYDLIEHVDDEYICLIVVAKDRDQTREANSPMMAFGNTDFSRGAPFVQLERMPNRAGMCTAVIPGRISLDRPAGQYDGMIGLWQQQAKLMALEVMAVEKGIFPEEWVIARVGEQPEIITPADSLHGVVGEIKGGDIKEIQINPGFITTNVIDRLERAQRLQGGIPAEFGGESTTNVRTGRRGDSILSAVVDFPVQSAQLVLARSLEEENRRAIAVSKSYFGNVKQSYYVNWKGAKGSVDYTPNEHFEIDDNSVTYAHAGADANGLVIALGQRIGVGTMSKQTAQEMDPFIDDAELEHDRVIGEALELALLQSLQQQAQAGALPANDLARIMQLVLEEKVTLAAAVTKAQQEAQERQATQAPPESPEAQPGLATAGMGAEAGAAVQPPSPSVSNLAQLLGQLRKPTQRSKAEAVA